MLSGKPTEKLRVVAAHLLGPVAILLEKARDVVAQRGTMSRSSVGSEVMGCASGAEVVALPWRIAQPTSASVGNFTAATATSATITATRGPAPTTIATLSASPAMASATAAPTKATRRSGDGNERGGILGTCERLHTAGVRVGRNARRAGGA